MKLEINIEKRYVFLIVGALLVLSLAYAYTYNSAVPSPGHGGDAVLITLNDGSEVTLQDAVTNGLIGNSGSSVVAGGFCGRTKVNHFDGGEFLSGGATCSYSGSVGVVNCPADTMKMKVSRLTNAGTGGEGAICIKQGPVGVGNSGIVEYLLSPILIFDENGANGGVQSSGDINSILTLDVSTLIPSNKNGIIVSLSSSFRSADDVRSRQQYFAWSTLPVISGLDLKSPYLVLNSEAGKTKRTGGEADTDFAGASNTFFIPIKNDGTFQISRLQENINLDNGFSIVLIAYT